eukprot:gb/GECG01013422.1/.p1 GENE.gb/GECG01013422.1/~~gb/GECG01013422.1/.p1  ORF type:complete len:139 (+),score=5.54 gb/GECG01013422.1/:1-417(+)
MDARTNFHNWARGITWSSSKPQQLMREGIDSIAIRFPHSSPAIASRTFSTNALFVSVSLRFFRSFLKQCVCHRDGHGIKSGFTVWSINLPQSEALELHPFFTFRDPLSMLLCFNAVDKKRQCNSTCRWLFVFAVRCLR